MIRVIPSFPTATGWVAIVAIIALLGAKHPHAVHILHNALRALIG